MNKKFVHQVGDKKNYTMMDGQPIIKTFISVIIPN
jgi:hypothetical protein